jgi:hypothetical protein
MKKLLTALTIFAIAMAFLETSVVIYLRELLYPGGFEFPLAIMPENLVLTEILREAATILMLIGAGYITGKTFSQRFAWFIYAFAIWDIFYYIFLKILINWPESFMTWDVLFLIPTTWTGPVISPVIVSFTMIALALVILYFSEKLMSIRIEPLEWSLLICGSIIVIIAFIYDYSDFSLEHFSLRDLWMIPDKEIVYDTAISYVPGKFNWSIFISGELVLLAAISRLFMRFKKVTISKP